MNTKTFGITFFISGFLLVLIIVLLNPSNIFIDSLILIGMFIITLFLIMFFLIINTEVNKYENREISQMDTI